MLELELEPTLEMETVKPLLSSLETLVSEPKSGLSKSSSRTAERSNKSESPLVTMRGLRDSLTLSS